MSYTTHKEILSEIKYVCTELSDFLIDKNIAYGNSVFDPIGIFAKGDPVELINTRIDYKLSRLARGNEYIGDDDIKDLTGYLILRMVLDNINRRKQLENESNEM